MANYKNAFLIAAGVGIVAFTAYSIRQEYLRRQRLFYNLEAPAETYAKMDDAALRQFTFRRNYFLTKEAHDRSAKEKRRVRSFLRKHATTDAPETHDGKIASIESLIEN